MFLGFYFVFYQAACGFCTRSTFLPWQATRAGTMTECSRPRRGMTMVASHFNGWVKDVNGKRAFRYATISGGVSRTYGTPAYAKYAIPAIKMAGYPYQMPTASSRGDVFMNTETQRHRVFLLSAEPIKKQEKQEKTMMVLFCFWGFILFFIRPLADFVPFSREKEIPATQNDWAAGRLGSGITNPL